MIKLDTITRSLQIVLSAAKTTTDMPVVVSYSERTATASTTTEGTQLASSNGTTAVTICAAPASSTIVRSVEHISVKNADTVAKTVTINLLDNATNYALITVTLAVGDELTYTAYAGWQVLDSNGNTKIVSYSATSSNYPISQELRLTLTTGVPVTTSDVTAATTVYLTPYKGNRIGLWDGSSWSIYTTAEISIPLGTLTSGKAYDVFCYQSSGVPTLELGTAWTNDTTRAVALAYQNGILVKSGDATRRYLGTFYTTSTTTTEDSVANRYLWNYYNRVSRSMRRIESTASWNYTTATWRQANASTSNQLNFIIGVAEDCVTVTVNEVGSNSTANINQYTGLALDSTTTPTKSSTFAGAAGIAVGISVSEVYYPSAGRHYIAWLEYSIATGTSTWYGTIGAIILGMSGNILA